MNTYINIMMESKNESPLYTTDIYKQLSFTESALSSITRTVYSVENELHDKLKGEIQQQFNNNDSNELSITVLHVVNDMEEQFRYTLASLKEDWHEVSIYNYRMDKDMYYRTAYHCYESQDMMFNLTATLLTQKVISLHNLAVI